MNDRTRLLIMLPVLGIAGWLAFFGDKTPKGEDAGVVASAVPGRAVTLPDRTAGAGKLVPATEAVAVPVAGSQPASARENMKLAAQDATAPNLFPSPAPPPAAPAANAEAERAAALPDFVVIGSMVKGGRLNVFLDKDNQTYVAVPGAVLDGNRVVSVGPDQVKLLNLSTKVTQIIPIEGDK
ncbi:MAG: hypothetical protein JWL63_2416 [Rhodocyclales bacterium]|nr:hypothetical protein [Rhodocyclales bacterium]